VLRSTNVIESPLALRWLEQLHGVLSRVRLPVRDIVLAEDVLSVDLAAEAGGALTAQVRLRLDGTQGFAQTKRFVIGYQGRGELALADKRSLELFVMVLKRVEDRLPPDLDGVGAFFVAPGVPEEQFLRLFPFCTVERSSAGAQQITEVLVRTTPTCNQKCPFCTAPDHKTPSAAVMRALLFEVPRVFPGAMLSLTGGEPTLRSSFLDEVAMATGSTGIGALQVQTNAVSFASKIDPKAISESSKLSFFVSLHAIDESIYDICTGTTGQLPLAKRGLNRLAEAGHRITINCVVNSANFDHLPDYVRGLPDIVPLNDRIDLHFSTLICPESKPGAEAFLVPYPALARRLRDMVSLANESGIVVQSLRASTHAAMPACQLDPDERSRDPHRPEVLPHESGRLEDNRPWVRAEGCSQCTEVRHCLGVPRPYALRFGLDDLQPIRKS